eukprot:56505-Rhodomonas_salina.1
MERGHRQLHKLLGKYDQALKTPLKLVLQQIKQAALSKVWGSERAELIGAVTDPAPSGAKESEAQPKKKKRGRRRRKVPVSKGAVVQADPKLRLLQRLSETRVLVQAPTGVVGA